MGPGAARTGLSLLTTGTDAPQTAPQRPLGPRATMTHARNLDLYALECLDMLMRERSVSRAAERMGISQSSMSEALARLRERLGDPVLVRTRDGMVPTERAQSLLPQVRSAIDQLRGLLDHDRGFDPAQAVERFRLTTSDYAQLLLMPTLTRQLQAEAPRCSVDVLPVNLRDVERALEAGDVDLAIAYYPDPPPGLRRGPLLADRYVCVARRGHPQVAQAMTPEAFAALPHAAVSPSGLSYFSNVVDSALATLRLSRRIVVSCPHFLLASHLVSQSDLVLALPRRAAMSLAAYFPLQTVEIPLPLRPVDVAMYWHERCHHSAAQQWLRGQVRRILGDSEALAALNAA